MFLGIRLRVHALAGILFLCIALLSGCGRQELTNEYVNRNQSSIAEDKITVESVKQVEAFSSSLAIIPHDYKNSFDLDEAIGELLLVNEDTNKVLYSSSSMQSTAMASTTKLMTAYVVLTHCKDLNEVVTVKHDIILEDGAVSIYLGPGDQITVDELLHGLLIFSANDCAVVLAEYISGSVDAFAELMNETAKEIGATRSQFKNPHGLDARGHYSCAYDLYLIFQKDLENEYFRKLISTKKYAVHYQRGSETMEVEEENTNQYFQKRYPTPEGITLVGGKTGTTTNAGHCLVLSGVNEKGEYLIGVVLNATDNNQLYETMTKLLTQNKVK